MTASHLAATQRCVRRWPANGKIREARMNDADDIENRPDLNTGEEWSEMDLLDLGNSVRLNTPEIASFMCRSRREIRDKLAELQQSGELTDLIKRATVAASNEPEDERRCPPTRDDWPRLTR